MPSHVSREEDGSRSWYTDYVKFILSWHPQWRRNMAVQKPFQNAIASSLLSPASAPTPTPPLSPFSPPTSAIEGATPPSYSPAPSPHPASATSPAAPIEGPYPFDFPYTDDSPGSKTSTSSNFHKIPHSHSPPLRQTSHKHNHHTTNDTIIAPTVILTAIGTFLFIALIFCCYNRHRRKNIDSGDAQKDERPLLNLSFSDFSVGSSLGGNSVSKDKFENSSVNKISQDQIGHASSLEIKLISIESDNTKSLLNEQTSTALGNNTTHASLPLPPGMVRPPIRAGPPLPGPPPPPPPIRAGTKLSGPRPPPPPKGAAPPRPPPPTSMAPKVSRPIPLAPDHLRPSEQHIGAKAEVEAPKTKLKPFFWDKVLADPDHSMVWHEISSGSFQFNEEMIESLFGYSAVNKPKSDRKKESSSNDPLSQHIQILDPKKSQNLSILLRASNVTMEEVGDALLEGNELPIEILRTLLKMAPTSEEELKLRLFSGELSQLGPAERFLKAMVDIPFAYKRMEALLFMGFLQEEVPSIKESFATLEVACKELRSSRLFLKLLEAVLKTGNRMNDGTYRGGAQAFKLDTLLKLADVKGTDGKTTLLHFVVQEIIRSEGIRAARVNRQSMSMSSINPADVSDESPHDTEDTHRALGLQVVSGLGVELENVRKAAALDADTLTNTVASFGHGLLKVKEFLNSEMKSVDEEDKFKSVLTCFAENAEIEITRLLEEEKRIRSLVKTTTDYFHGNTGKDEGLHLFVIVRDFLAMVDKACREVKAVPKKIRTTSVNKEASVPLVVDSQRQLLFPAIKDRRMDSSSSDDERE